MTLYNDVRPKDFDEFLGNKSTVNSLKNLIESKNPPHVFLFVGPSGCGKTTLARIVAQKMGCDINEPRDFYEINSSNNRGIDEARKVLEICRFKPLKSKKRGFLLDEIHMTTKEFQNAMLKPLEDTPKHILFFLCTTDPQKIIKTLQNRCSIFEVTPLDDKDFMSLLKKHSRNRYIVEKNDLARNLYEISEGCPRKALVILEQVQDLGKGETIDFIKNYVSEETQIIEICRALMQKKSWAVVANCLRGLENENPETMRRVILGYCWACIKNKTNPDPYVDVIYQAMRDNFFNETFAAFALRIHEIYLEILG